MKFHHPIIRPYRNEDRDPVLDIWLAASRLGHPFLGEDELAAQRRLVRDVYLPKAETWIAAGNSIPLGFIGLLGNFIGGLFVDPEAGRRGIGTALVDHALGIKGTLEVEVYAANTVAVPFYRSRGFVEIARRAHDDEGRPFELIRMRCAS